MSSIKGTMSKTVYEGREERYYHHEIGSDVINAIFDKKDKILIISELAKKVRMNHTMRSIFNRSDNL